MCSLYEGSKRNPTLILRAAILSTRADANTLCQQWISTTTSPSCHVRASVGIRGQIVLIFLAFLTLGKPLTCAYIRWQRQKQKVKFALQICPTNRGQDWVCCFGLWHGTRPSKPPVRLDSQNTPCAIWLRLTEWQIHAPNSANIEIKFTPSDIWRKQTGEENLNQFTLLKYWNDVTRPDRRSAVVVGPRSVQRLHKSRGLKKTL